MRFLTGDEIGILKWVKVEAQKIERFGPQRRGDAVQRLCWAGPAANREARVAVGFASGAVELRDGTTGEVIAETKIDVDVRCVQALGSGDLLVVAHSGAAGIIVGWCGDTPPVPDAEGEAEGEDGKSGPVVRSFTLPGPVVSAQADPAGSGRIVFGGGENDVKIWDLERGEVTWKAKNVRESTICLRVPVKVSSLQWATPMCSTRSLITCCTSDGKIRLYDASSQRRPLLELVLGLATGGGTGGYTGTFDDMPRPVTCSAVAKVRGDSWGIFVGNTMGVLREFDLVNFPKLQTAQSPPGRKAHHKWANRQLPFKRGYRGVMGSIRAVDVHSSGDAVVAVGLGRFAYLFSTRKKPMVSKVYLKQKLCSCLFSSEEPAKEASDDENSEEEAAEDGEAEAEEHNDNAENDEVQEGFSSDEDAEGKIGEGGDAEEGAASAKRKKRRRPKSGEARPKAAKVKRRTRQKKDSEGAEETCNDAGAPEASADAGSDGASRPGKVKRVKRSSAGQRKGGPVRKKKTG
eukprot:CAMPEP_0170594372 /NCGR_PEP_ID=MMETSP0224-20130122/13962_1 /TAXON_ID=285029 /ORGANISM="Togula jolla, Strain CCCM 725" /LENGTH=517 /DNA_ID=CAMNT_0010918419 /DNA_START=79 /DNA_END=1629 /DNA_ORIENTATION=+